MKILLEAFGQLKKYFGNEVSQVELKDNAIIADFLEMVKLKWGDQFPEYLWDDNKKGFRGPIMLIINGTVQLNQTKYLHNGDYIQLIKVKVGG
jgi:hypothetical protein